MTRGGCGGGTRLAMAFGLLAVLGGCGGGFVEDGASLPGGCGHPQRGDAWRPGCATHRNMAAMAADPDDLTRARAESPRDAMRRDAVIAAYAGKGAGGGSAPSTAAGAASEKGSSQ